MIDLKDIGKYRENNRLEAKRAQGGFPESLWETYSAFANSFGGVILLGVIEQSDKFFRTVPLPNPEALVEEFWETLRDPSKISVNILTENNVQIVESQGNRIVVIEVPRANRHDKPVYIGTDPFSGSYRRNGDGDYHCTPEEVQTMLRDREDSSRDSHSLEHMGLDSLDSGSIERYRLHLLDPELAKLQNEQLLLYLLAAVQGEDQRLHPTAAGLLMFGRYDQIMREFSHYSLDYQDQNIHIRSDDGTWSGNILDFYLLTYNRISQDLPCVQGPSSVDSALKEALANALMHADYYDRKGLVIRKTADRVVIENPGVLRISPDAALSRGISDPRNCILIRMFNLIGVGTSKGLGLANIHDVWSRQGWREPNIKEYLNPDRTVISLMLDYSSDDIQLLLEYLTDHISCKLSDAARLLGISVPRARQLLEDLLRRGVIVQEGRLYKLKS